MSKKINLAGALLGAVISTSTMSYASEQTKCGAGKCGSNMKSENSVMKKDGKCGAGKCGSNMKSENSVMKKDGKCGAGKCGAE
jgi:uncharacterized low-complexity protein